MAEITLTLNSPITEEQWDALTDVDLEHTNEITFHTKHGKKVTFVKRKMGKWAKIGDCNTVQCSKCLDDFDYIDGLCYICHGQELPNFCPNCGADMRGENDEQGTI